MKKICCFLYNQHNKETITILEKINAESELYKRYDMHCSKITLQDELPSILNFDEKIKFLINANYVEEMKHPTIKIYRLTNKGKEILRKYSNFNNLNEWYMFVTIIKENYSTLALIISITSLLISILRTH